MKKFFDLPGKSYAKSWREIGLNEPVILNLDRHDMTQWLWETFSKPLIDQRAKELNADFVIDIPVGGLIYDMPAYFKAKT